MPGKKAKSNPKLDAVDDVLVDDDGRFKYILCKVSDPDSTSEFKYIVRGTTRAEWHSDIYDDVDTQLEEVGLVCECLGGGKITHSTKDQTIEIGGESQGYGKANHSLTAELLTKKYPQYTSITYSD